MPRASTMTTRPHDRVRAALQRLANASPTAEQNHPPMPLLLRPPYLIALWALLLLIAAAGLALRHVAYLILPNAG